ncbi:tyrosine kinase catalytic domain protein [Rhizoctonia solani AG-3 Rhs1AP]|uniref:Tyrosine kinase catalytic domain protein n=2 Tax=Rhizoctonia solani AG-3 TaxID=1086053 RepID=A0A074RPL7_9AGAM|nr:tyrosine kinase catalytic domain protein [Rhizoctonia solani AG-3 Rhs1AP]KEP47255.1 tyrosine kinase catalytic domain protein [Rhizoctonia solani 123E]
MNVHQGCLHDGTKLAIKKVRPGEDYNSRNNSAGKFQKRLAMELYTWSQCDHRNVWPLMGLADFDGRLAIISVWADHGNLVQYLEKTPNANRCELVLGITTGLAYLHRNGIVHGDLKGLNVLISASRTPMLCDFGNSVIEESTLLFADSRSGIGNTLRWAAPELLTGETQALSPATDVYSLGMTILETFTGKPPYANLSDHSVLSVIQKKKLPARPEKEVPVESPYGNILWTLLRSCWSHNPNMRPTVRAVRYIVSNLPLRS